MHPPLPALPHVARTGTNPDPGTSCTGSYTAAPVSSRRPDSASCLARGNLGETLLTPGPCFVSAGRWRGHSRLHLFGAGSCPVCSYYYPQPEVAWQKISSGQHTDAIYLLHCFASNSPDVAHGWPVPEFLLVAPGCLSYFLFERRRAVTIPQETPGHAACLACLFSLHWATAASIAFSTGTSSQVCGSCMTALRPC